MSNNPMVDLTGAKLVPIDNVQYNSTYWTALEAIDDYILEKDHSHSSCAAVTSLFGRNGKPAPAIYGRWNGMDLVYDPRLVLEVNTVENPLRDGGGTAVVETNGQMMCSNAPRSFINEDYCMLSTAQTACSSKVPPVMTVKLDQTNLAKLSQLVTNVYAFVDIPITTATYVQSGITKFYLQRPCDSSLSTVNIRFERMSTSSCSQNPLKVKEVTRSVLAKYLKPEFDDPINPYPKYKTIERTQFTPCASSDQTNTNLFDLGFITGEDGSCWKHVHPLEGNTYGKVYVSIYGYR